MKILIIRHAEPDYTAGTLTEKGFREAELLGEKLKTMQIDYAFSSPYQRAVLTAEPWKKRTGCQVEIADWLREFPGTIISENGEKRIPWNLEPRTWCGRNQLYDINRWAEDNLMNSCDTISVYDHVNSCFDELLESYGYKRDVGTIYQCDENKNLTIALFCHFGLGMVLISHLCGISPVLLWQSMFLPTSSVTEFVTEERKKGEVVFKCVQLGDTSHLYRYDELVSKSGLFPEFFGGEGRGPQV